jgi:hypothetical protein
MKRVDFFLAGLAAFLLGVSGAWGGELKPGDFPWGVEVRVESGPETVVAVLPPAVRKQAARPDLGDLRVFNADGCLLPHRLLWGADDGSPKVHFWQLPKFGNRLREGTRWVPHREKKRALGAIGSYGVSAREPAGGSPYTIIPDDNQVTGKWTIDTKADRTRPEPQKYQPVAVRFIPWGKGPFLLAFGAAQLTPPHLTDPETLAEASFSIDVDHGEAIRAPGENFVLASANVMPLGGGDGSAPLFWRRFGLYAVLALCLGLTALMAQRLYAEVMAGEKARARDQKRPPRRRASEMLASLDEAGRRDFEQLRSLCRRLRGIARGVRGDDAEFLGDISENHAAGINRLLWIYLKLLYTRGETERFFQAVDPAHIDEQIRRSRERLAALGEDGGEAGPVQAGQGDSPGEGPMDRRRKSLIDLLETAERRRQNYRLVEENHAFISLELERLSLKIASVLEMGVHPQRADDIAGEIDAVAASVGYAEQTLRELETVMGLSLEESEPPRLLEIAPAA